MNSYNKLIHLFVLIKNVYLFRSLVGYILVLITDLPVEHTLVLIVDLYLFGGTRKYYRTYTYMEVLVGTTKLILIRRYP